MIPIIDRIFRGGSRRFRLPNFLIVGAAKAGTTAIASFLEQHPDIYMSMIKEPKFISSHFLDFPLKGPGDDFVEAFTVKKLEEYHELFRNVHREKAVGEASVENLYYHKQSIPVIKRLLNDPKIIIILRDPVSRAFSAYKMMVRDGRETLTFEEALRQEQQRREENWEYLWFYTAVGRYYQQVNAYLEAFTHVKIMFFDDFKEDPLAFMKELYGFLEVNDSFKPHVELKINASGRLQNAFYRFLFRATGFKGMLYKFLSLNGVPESTMLGLVESIREGDLQPLHLNPHTKEALRNQFRPDILKLQELIGRDLSDWLV
jgi:hypothetical protein